jgi:flagellar export protein FliJ
VLDHREMIEDQRQRRVAEIERERVRIEESIRATYRAILAEQHAARLLAAKGDIPGARRQGSAITALHQRAQRAVVELSGVHARLDAARAELLAATIARKSVDLLRERRYEEWKRDIDRREQAALDELAVMRAGWKELDA